MVFDLRIMRYGYMPVPRFRNAECSILLGFETNQILLGHDNPHRLSYDPPLQLPACLGLQDHYNAVPITF